MKLNNHQITFYNQNGFLFLENVFEKKEINLLTNAFKKFKITGNVPEITKEEDGNIRSIFSPHNFLKGFDELFRQERLCTPVSNLIEGDFYLQQFKLNTKRSLNGAYWEWHQDFPFWHFQDKILRPEMVSVMVLLQDTDEIQGPLIIAPGSHKNGIAAFQEKNHIEKTSSYDEKYFTGTDLIYSVSREELRKTVLQNKLVSIKGKAGSIVFFHPNLFHASNVNLSPFDRNTAIITYNLITNKPTSSNNKRPNYLSSVDFNSINPLKKFSDE